MPKNWTIAALVVALLLGAGAYAIHERTSAPESATPVAANGQPDAPVVLAQGDVKIEITPEDRVLGSPDAPVTMVEYASLTCPHCADFANETLPKIKENYIDKNLVRLVYRDYPLDQSAYHAALIARCAPAERYFNMIEVLFRTQRSWAGAPDPDAALQQLARTAGMDVQKLDACTKDKVLEEQVLGRVKQASEDYGVRSTPTFFINGRLVQGALPYEEYEKVIKEALPKG